MAKKFKNEFQIFKQKPILTLLRKYRNAFRFSFEDLGFAIRVFLATQFNPDKRSCAEI